MAENWTESPRGRRAFPDAGNEKIGVAQHLLLQAPPGEFREVLADVEARASASTSTALPSTRGREASTALPSTRVEARPRGFVLPSTRVEGRRHLRDKGREYSRLEQVA